MKKENLQQFNEDLNQFVQHLYLISGRIPTSLEKPNRAIITGYLRMIHKHHLVGLRSASIAYWRPIVQRLHRLYHELTAEQSE